MTKSQIAGWALSLLVALFLIGLSAVGKFTDFEGKAEMFDHLGWSIERMRTIGVVEVVVTLVFLAPRVGFIGAILVTGYLGGAVATHVRVGDPWFFPIIIGVVAWVAIGLRVPGVFQLALGGATKNHKQDSTD